MSTVEVSTQVRLKLQFHFAHALKVLNNPQCSLEQVYSILEQIAFLVDLTPANIEIQRQFSEFSLESLKSEFKLNLYKVSFSEILSNFEKFLGKNTTTRERTDLQQIKSLIVQIMTSTNFSDSFNILYDICTSLKPGHHRDFILYLLRQFVNKHLLQKLFIENTKLDTAATKLGLENKRQNLFEDKLVQKVVNLPDKLANLFDPKTLNIHFTPKFYFKVVSTDIWLSLKHIHNKLTTSSTVSFDGLAEFLSIDFINSVYGKISLLGYSEVLSANFLKNLTTACYIDKSESWSKLAQLMFASIPYKYLESCLLNIVVNSNNSQDVFKLIGSLALTNNNFKYLLCDKFLFMKIFNKENSIQNLIGYLCCSDKSRQLYYEVFSRLLSAWSTQTSIINTSYEQHLYLTKCIIVCLAFSEETDKTILSQDLMGLLLRGVECHLHSPIENLRILGMIVGENLMNDLNPANSSKSEEPTKQLKFEYTETEETKALNSLKTRPVVDVKQFDFNNGTLEKLYEQDEIGATAACEKTLFDSKNLNLKITVDEEDSDDDLMPYDTSNDVPLSKLKQPAYLRDCLHALIYSDDPEKIEISLKSVENLCDKYHFELEEICVEMLKIILHKSNNYSIENFEDIRMNALISLTVHYPKESAQYLTSQFYEPGYTLTQRTDILSVLVMSAQKLSNPNEDPIFDKRVFNHQNLSLSALINLNTKINKQPLEKKTESSNKPDDWREIVRKRIESKTKYKRQPGAKTATVIKQKQNIYSECYGFFFFPLLRPYDTNRVHLNIIEKDFMLLGKMIFSLSVILFSSVNTTVVNNMVSALLDFIWALRNHPEPFVRKSNLFALSIILIVIHDTQLIFGLENYFTEMKYWLEGIIINDPDVECQKRAVDCMGLLGQRLKEKFHGKIENV